MTYYEKQMAMEGLLRDLTEKLQQYRESLNRDDILSVRKVIRLEIKEIQRQIDELKEYQPV